MKSRTEQLASNNKSHEHKRRFFSTSHKNHHGTMQTTNVTVNVEQPKQDCLSGCFAALAQCFKPK